MDNQETYISTAQVEPRFYEEFRRACMRLLHVPSLTDEGKERGETLEASIRSRTFGELLILSTTHNTHSRLRDRQMVVKSDLDFYIVSIVQSGLHVGDFGGVSMSASPGDLYITDMNQPFTCLVGAGAVSAFILERTKLDAAVNHRNLHGIVLKKQWPLTQVLTNYLLGLHAVAGQLSPDQSGPVHEALLTLLSGSVSRSEIAPSAVSPALNQALRHRILTFIDQHILDADLGPESLLRQFRLSRSHLYRLFEADGGVAKIIREKKLDLAFRQLSSPAQGQGSIKQIAYDFGFADSSKFIRAFRARFNETPKRVRQGEYMSQTFAESAPLKLQSYLERFLAEG